jgi:hypothetical protein
MSDNHAKNELFDRYAARSRLYDNDLVAHHYEIVAAILRYDRDYPVRERVESYIFGYGRAHSEREIDAIKSLYWRAA